MLPAVQRFLDGHTRLEGLGQGVYRHQVEEGPFWGMATPHGGFAMALLLHAMQTELGDAARRPRVFTQQFLGQVPTGPVDIEVQVERQGRAVSSATARLRAKGDTPLVATGVFTTDREGPAFLDEPMPEVAAPDRPDEDMVGFGMAPVHQNFTFHRRFGSEGTELPCEDGGWIVPIESQPWDHRLALVASDVWCPPIIRNPERVAPTPSLHHVVHFGPDVEGDADVPLLVRHRLSSGAAGVTEEDIALWAGDGRLLLRARQLRTVVSVDRMGVPAEATA